MNINSRLFESALKTQLNRFDRLTTQKSKLQMYNQIIHMMMDNYHIWCDNVRFYRGMLLQLSSVLKNKQLRSLISDSDFKFYIDSLEYLLGRRVYCNHVVNDRRCMIRSPSSSLCHVHRRMLERRRSIIFDHLPNDLITPIFEYLAM